MQQIHKLDFTSADFKRNPIPRFEAMRALGPVVRTKVPILGKAWITTTYEATDKVLRDQEHFCTDATNAGHRSHSGKIWWLPKVIRSMMKNMLTMDEPDHRRLRSLVESAFVKQSVDAMRPRIEAMVDHQLDQMQAAAKNGVVDLQHNFARQVPLTVILELLGLPDEDRAKFSKWSDFTAAKGPISILRALGGLKKLQRYLREQFVECRKNPRPGMMSALVEAEQEGDRLNEEELMASVMILLLAGHETTTHLITVGFLSLTQHAEAKLELMSDWSLADAAVDEMLRFNSTIQTTKPRYIKQDLEFYGQQLKRGEFFLPLLAAGNYDPAEFPLPERFDIHRRNNHHMAFGRGIHVCLGLKLAKLEASISFERLFTRFPDINLATTLEELRWSRRIGQRSLLGLPVRLS